MNFKNLKQNTTSFFFLVKKLNFSIYPEGLRLHKLNRLEEALAAYDMAIKHSPTHSNAYSNRGLCLHNLNRHDEALASFDMAIKHDPTDSNVYFNKGNCLFDLNRLDEALLSFDLAIKHNPTYSLAYNNKLVYGNLIDQMRHLPYVTW